MTAETLKPFLGASGAQNASNGGQKSLVVSMTNTESPDEYDGAGAAGDRRTSPVLAARKNARLFSFCAIVSICVVALIGTEIWNTVRTERLQREVYELSAQLKGLIRLTGLDEGSKLDELADMYQHAKTNRPVNEYDIPYVEDDDNDDTDSSRLRDDIMVSDDDYYEEDDFYPHGSGDDDDDDDDDMPGSIMYEDVDEPLRERRSLTESLRHGTIVETTHKDEVMQHIIPYQEVSPDDLLDPLQHATVDHAVRPKSRRNRVATSLNERMAKMPPTKKTTDVLKKVHHGKKMDGQKKVRPMMQMRKNLVTRSARRSHPIAVHYVGHTDHYNANHPHYAGNGRLQHHGGIYADWRPANWTSALMTDRYFSMQHGVVTVQEPGLYHVYAQIYYYDAADESSFWVDHNERHLLQCATTVISTGTEPKASTCYTAGLVYLHAGDRIRVHDLLRHYALLRPERSFFGLVRLAGGAGGGGSSAGARSDESA